MPTFSISRNKRIDEIDILRAVAVLMVLGRHILHIPVDLPSGIRTFLLAWREVGWSGVDLFFVISGFLVSGLLFVEYKNEQKVSVSRFLIRRAFKIILPYYFFLAVTLGESGPYEWWQYAGEFLFFQNYLGAIWNHTWSLAVEEHFYLFLSVFISCLIRANRGHGNPFKFLPTFIGVAAIVILAARYSVGMHNPVGAWHTTLPYTHLRIDSLLFGVLLAYLFHFRPRVLEWLAIRAKGGLIIVCLCCFCLPWLFPLSESRFSYIFGFTALYIGSGSALVFLLLSPSVFKSFAVRLCGPILVPIGKASYSIYLWHMLIYNISARTHLNGDNLAGNYMAHLLVYLLGSILVGILMYRLIELPSLILRDRFLQFCRSFRGTRTAMGANIPWILKTAVKGMHGLWQRSKKATSLRTLSRAIGVRGDK